MMVDYSSRNNNFVGMRKDEDVREVSSRGLESMERLIGLLSQPQSIIFLVLLEVAA